MPAGSTTPDVLLLSVITQLTTAMPAYCTSANTYLTLSDPWDRPVSNPGGPGDSHANPPILSNLFMFGVAPLNGQFAIENQVGGGQADLRASSGVLVVIHSPEVLDQAERDVIFLTDSTVGIFKIATLVLQAMVNFIPVDANTGDYLVADPFLGAGWEIRREDRSLGAIGLGFRVAFDWDLGAG